MMCELGKIKKTFLNKFVRDQKSTEHKFHFPVSHTPRSNTQFFEYTLTIKAYLNRHVWVRSRLLNTGTNMYYTSPGRIKYYTTMIICSSFALEIGRSRCSMPVKLREKSLQFVYTNNILHFPDSVEL